VLLPEPFLERPVHVTPTDINYIWVCSEKDYGYGSHGESINTPAHTQLGSDPEAVLDPSVV
jgi:hypothetical protein